MQGYEHRAAKGYEHKIPASGVERNERAPDYEHQIKRNNGYPEYNAELLADDCKYVVGIVCGYAFGKSFGKAKAPHTARGYRHEALGNLVAAG